MSTNRLFRSTTDIRSGDSKRAALAFDQLRGAKQQQLLAEQHVISLQGLSTMYQDSAEFKYCLEQAIELEYCAREQAVLAKNRLSPYVDEMKDIIVKRFKKYFHEHNADLLTLVTEYSQLTQAEIIQRTLQLIGSGLRNEVTIKYLNGTNNRNLLVMGKDGIELLVIQLTNFSENTNNALIKIEETHRSVMPIANSLFEGQLKRSGSANNNNEYLSLRIMEYYQSLSEKIIDIHTHSLNDTENKRLVFAVKYAQQVIDLLLQLNQLKLFWTDLKPNNLLIDSKGKLIITDFKGVNQVETTYTKDDKGCFHFIFETTSGLLSSDFFTNLQTLRDEDVHAAWMHEYSYQMAVILYYLCTNDLVVINHHDQCQKLYAGFTFKSPLFNSDEGRRLKLIIKLLSGQAFNDVCQRVSKSEKHDTLSSSQRISVEEAKSLLDALNSEMAFKKILNQQLEKCSSKVKKSIFANLKQPKVMNNASSNSNLHSSNVPMDLLRSLSNNNAVSGQLVSSHSDPQNPASQYYLRTLSSSQQRRESC